MTKFQDLSRQQRAALRRETQIICPHCGAQAQPSHVQNCSERIEKSESKKQLINALTEWYPRDPDFRADFDKILKSAMERLIDTNDTRKLNEIYKNIKDQKAQLAFKNWALKNLPLVQGKKDSFKIDRKRIQEFKETGVARTMSFFGSSNLEINNEEIKIHRGIYSTQEAIDASLDILTLFRKDLEKDERDILEKILNSNKK